MVESLKQQLTKARNQIASLSINGSTQDDGGRMLPDGRESNTRSDDLDGSLEDIPSDNATSSCNSHGDNATNPREDSK